MNFCNKHKKTGFSYFLKIKKKMYIVTCFCVDTGPDDISAVPISVNSFASNDCLAKTILYALRSLPLLTNHLGDSCRNLCHNLNFKTHFF